MNKTVLVIISIGLALSIGFIFLGGSGGKMLQNVEMKDGIQYVTITALGGYQPSVSLAKAGIPTKLIMKTKGTFDCSSALVIRSINYQNILPRNGTTEIDIGVGEAGGTLEGVCSMGMYSFRIDFS